MNLGYHGGELVIDKTLLDPPDARGMRKPVRVRLTLDLAEAASLLKFLVTYHDGYVKTWAAAGATRVAEAAARREQLLKELAAVNAVLEPVGLGGQGLAEEQVG